MATRNEYLAIVEQSYRVARTRYGHISSASKIAVVIAEIWMINLSAV